METLNEIIKLCEEIAYLEKKYKLKAYEVVTLQFAAILEVNKEDYNSLKEKIIQEKEELF